MLEIDPVLDSFMQAAAGEEREDQLEKLVLESIPIIRRVLRHRLGFHVNAKGENARTPDAADLFHEILVRILQRLHSLQIKGGGEEIRDFGAYVSRTAGNACHDYLRERNPLRHLLKNRIRYLLHDRPELVVREHLHGGRRAVQCGLSTWSEDLWRQPPTDARGAVDADDPLKEWLQTEFGTALPLDSFRLSRVLLGILTQIGHPVELDRLVYLVTSVRGTPEWTVESIDEEENPLAVSLPDPRPRIDQQLEEEELLQRLWEAILTLPLVQRRIVLLGQGDERGHDLWSLLLEAGTIPLAELCAGLELEPIETAALWAEIPLDTSALANYLNLTRTQVIRWKFYARQQLRKQLLLASSPSRKKSRISTRETE